MARKSAQAEADFVPVNIFDNNNVKDVDGYNICSGLRRFSCHLSVVIVIKMILRYFNYKSGE